MKIRILDMSTAFALLFVWTPLAAAEHTPLPPAVEARIEQIAKACVTQIVGQVDDVERAGGIPRYIVNDANGQMQEVNRLEFIAIGAQQCAFDAAAKDPLVAPHLVPAAVAVPL